MWLSIVVNPGSYFGGMYRWYQLALFGAAFLALAAFNRNQTIAWKYLILWAVMAVDVIYLLVDLTIGRRPVTGPFVNPNYFASFLLVGFAASLGLVFFQRTRSIRIAGAVIAAFLYYGMTQASSRGATVAAIAVAGVATMRLGKKYAVPAIGVCLLATAAASPLLVQKFLDTGAGDPYNYMRPQIWLSTLKLVAQNPFLGVGLDQFNDASKQFAPAIEGQIGRYLKRPGIAHSEYLQYAAEIGLPGALLLFALAGYMVFLAAKRAHTCASECRIFQETSILTAAGIGVHALVDNNWSVPVMAAGLVVFSAGDIVPRRPWGFRMEMPLWKRPALAALAMFTLLLFAHSTLIPSIGLYFNEAGHRAYLANNLASAESLHRISAAITPACATCLDNAGLVYLDQYPGKRDEKLLDFADALFSQAIKTHPTSQEPRRHMEAVLIHRLTGDVQKDRDIHLRIIETDRGILRIDPFNPFVRKNLAEALYNSGFREEAERELHLAIEFEPNFVPGYLRIAEWHEQAEETADAESYRQKAASVIARYRDLDVNELYDAQLLGRPQPRPAND
jgi:O-antigen ligase